MKNQTVCSHTKRLALLLLCLLLAAGCLLPALAFAEETDRKVVRVGWHEPPFFITDEYGL